MLIKWCKIQYLNLDKAFVRVATNLERLGITNLFKKSGLSQGIWKLVLFRHVFAYLFLVNLFFAFRALVFQENF